MSITSNAGALLANPSILDASAAAARMELAKRNHELSFFPKAQITVA